MGVTLFCFGPNETALVLQWFCLGSNEKALVLQWCCLGSNIYIGFALHPPGGESTIAKGRRAPMEQLMGAIQMLFLKTLQQHTQTHNDTPTYAYAQ